MANPRSLEIVCLGGATLDRKYRAAAPLAAATSNPAVASVHFGGVARNVCETLARLGVAAGLHSLAGDDAAGAALAAHLAASGADVAGLRILPGQATAEYAAVLEPAGELALGLAAMAIFDSFGLADADAALARKPAWIFADCNLPPPVLRHLIAACRDSGQKLAIDGVSAPKIRRLPQDCDGIDTLFLNADEAAALLGAELPPVEAAARLRARGIANVVLTLGPDGLVVAQAGSVKHLHARKIAVRDATGAGDALIAATLARLLAGDILATAAGIGANAAALTLASADSVRPDLAQALAARLAGDRTDACRP